MQAAIRQSKRERRMDDYHVNELQIRGLGFVAGSSQTA